MNKKKTKGKTYLTLENNINISMSKYNININFVMNTAKISFNRNY